MSVEQSPIYRAVWGPRAPMGAFTPEPISMAAGVRASLDRSIEVVRRHRRAGTLYDDRGVVSDETIADLADAGYWGLRAEARYGGAGGSFAMLAQAIREMFLADPWVAGMASIHAALGPVGELEDFGTPEQKARLLPPLARGERLGAFAVTEPGTSSDWGKMGMVARRDGERLLVSGEKLFISNAAPGRTIGLLCQLDGRLEVLVVELPDHQDEHFQIVDYDLRAPAHVLNAGLRFRDLPVPAANLLVPWSGDGRTIARRALNHGRVAVCAFAAGGLRQIAGSLIPWVQRRDTFGAVIGTRELVQRRLGRLAARIVACDALVGWAAPLLDEGGRGELECVTTKVFASEAIKEASVDILLKTQGARAFLQGNLFADSIFDYLAPTVYEGENEILTLGIMSTLGKNHGERYLLAIADAAKEAGFDGLDLNSPRQLWAVRRPLAAYLAWVAGRQAQRLGRRTPPVEPDADRLAELAAGILHDCALEISEALRHGRSAEHQALLHDLSRRVQNATVLLVVSRYAAHQEDPLVRDAAICMGMELGHGLLGTRPSPRYYKLVTELGAVVADDGFAPVAGAERAEVAMAEHLEPLPPTRLGGDGHDLTTH